MKVTKLIGITEAIDEIQKTFTRDVLSIEISGPNQL